MNLYINNHTFHYEMENLVRAFFVYDKISVIKEYDTLETPYVLTSYTDEICVKVSFDGVEKLLSAKKTEDPEKDELIMAQLMYKLMCEYFSTTLPWGVLTGVRPSKLLINTEKQMGREKTEEYFKKDLLVSDEKFNLANVSVFRKYAYSVFLT